ncbi:NAD(P)-dependent oxidoreductase [Leifsonia sp. PS1209]|uniref:NAD(P)-dependent oxidoreductase n=1 Tax=Leifsonia sp. PS1209 TaxID=2724914 RepID=UPI001442A8FA|nr:NAD(P)-dependent oxidoreductase [Leifsonia sp. PS1209]QIZ98434.1 NAD(P)-dependent oxidoreductase [Leifsonia sp. PS1209]
MNIAFLGLGRMGRELVPHLIDAGHRVTVWNRSPEPAQAMGRRGAAVAQTAAEAVDGAQAVVSALFGPDAVREVIVDGGLPFASGAVWIDITTVSPADASDFSAWAAGAGVSYVHSPVIGSLAPARAASLGVLIGGEHDAARIARTIVALWADPNKLRMLDTPEQAAAGKLVANLALAVSFEGLVEALRLGESGGLSAEQVLDTLGITALAPIAAMKGGPVVSGDFDDTQFSAALLAKDTRLMLATSRDPLPAVSLVSAALEDAVDTGDGDKDFSVIAARR